MHNDPDVRAPADATAALALVGDLGSETLAALARHVHAVSLATGDPLFPDEDIGGDLYLVESGQLLAVKSGAATEQPPVRILSRGETVDHLQRLAGRGAPPSVVAAEPTSLLIIPGDAVDRLAERFDDLRDFIERVHRRQLLCRLHPILGTLDATFLDDLERAAEWVYIGRGELLFEQNDPSDGLFFVVSGRVQAIRHERDGRDHTLVEAGHGDVIGEVEYFTEEPRGSRVEAVRDSVLVRFSDAAFETLVAKRPRILRRVTRSVATRAQLPALGGRSSGRVSTIAVVPSGHKVQLEEFTERLVQQLTTHGPVLRLTGARVDELMDEPGISHAWEGSAESGRLLAWLESREDLNRFVVYQADPTVTPWTRRCLRQADRVLLVAHEGDDPAPTEVERALVLLEGRITDAHQALVLVHPDGSCLPTGTRRWLEPRPFLEEHFHLRWDVEDDFARVARTLAGRAVGLVLGGGGARGFAHIGILRALQEAGVPIDRIRPLPARRVPSPWIPVMPRGSLPEGSGPPRRGEGRGYRPWLPRQRQPQIACTSRCPAVQHPLRHLPRHHGHGLRLPLRPSFRWPPHPLLYRCTHALRRRRRCATRRRRR